MPAHNSDEMWKKIRQTAVKSSSAEPILASFFHSIILNHDSLECSLSFLLASKLGGPAAPAMMLREVIEQAMGNDKTISISMRADLQAVLDRDSACESALEAFLFLKGFHALQSHRIAHWLWLNDRQELALFLQNRSSEVFGVDSHPAAQIGSGIMLDHATGIVIGETAVVEDNVSIMQSVTLGGTGKETDDRHPKIRAGVMIGPGAKILGNIEIGIGAKICAGSVVLKPVNAHTIVTGVPAKEVGKTDSDQPALEHDVETALADNDVLVGGLGE